jgi:hypothetical protein
MSDDEIMSLLPVRIADLARAIGLTAALKIVELRGGGILSVPKKCKDNHWLIEHIGKDSFYKLTQYYSGEGIAIDRCVKLLRTIRNNVIKQRLANGETVWQIASEFNFCTRTIRNIKSQK